MSMRQGGRSEKVDATDERILAELSRDGRLTNIELARRVGLSPSPCWTRVRRLEEQGVIERYAALLNNARLGLKQTVLVEVTLEKHGGDTMDAFARSIATMPEVLEASMVAGECDFHLKVATADTEAYERFLREKLYRVPSVRQVRSVLVLRKLPTHARP